MRRIARAAPACGWLLLASASAHAHLRDTGLGPVADGAAHLFLSFDDLLAVVAMAVLASQHDEATAQRAAGTLPAAWFIGAFAGFAAGKAFLPASTTSLTLLALGVLIAAGRRLPKVVVTALAAAVGLVHGLLNGASLAIGRHDGMALAGIFGAVLVVATLIVVPGLRLHATGARIALRVAGSWIAAIGLLYLGWAWSGRF